jgi:Tfp pilus assembly protein PilF
MRRAVASLLLALATALGCAAAPREARDPLLAAREAAEGSTDADLLGRALLYELTAVGGSTTKASEVSARLRKLPEAERDASLLAAMAHALDDELHGALGSAVDHYVRTLEVAKSFEGPEGTLLATYAASRLVALRSAVVPSYEKDLPRLRAVFESPGRIGHRARTDLLAILRAASKDEAGRKVYTDQGGCITAARFAGPFGRSLNVDVFEPFPAELPGPWPSAFPSERLDGSRPVVRPSVADECNLSMQGAPDGGARAPHFVETFITLEQPVEALLSISGAMSIRVNDVVVMEHDVRSFGSFITRAVALSLPAGRHRVVGRLLAPSAELRLIDRWGAPIPFVADVDGALPYSLVAPRPLHNAHVLAPWFAEASVKDPGSWPAPPSSHAVVDPDDPALRFFAAALASSDGQHDLATVLLEPLVREQARAAAPTLALAASAAEEDPIFSEGDATDLAFMYRKAAIEKDARLWYPQLWLQIRFAEKEGLKTALEPLVQLSRGFPEVSEVTKALAALYGKLGYRVEQKRTLAELAARFPEDPDILRANVPFLEEDGRRAEAKKLAERVDALTGSRGYALERALSRGEWETAHTLLGAEIAAMEGKAREVATLRADTLLVRAGKSAETDATLERMLELDPTSTNKSLALADFRFARGDRGALRAAVADAHKKGLDPGEIADAVELVEGRTDLSPFRVDGLAEIRKFETSGAAARGRQKTKAGTAARVLDYAAVWVYRDGSARMLEHEILFMQSSEAIQRHAEQRLPKAKLLRIRTVKADGTTFEPEIVSGKPTATMPHLEVGDYIETETLHDLRGDGRGERFMSPRWFFREEGVDYQRSEFVVITPKDRELAIETTGDVPPPAVETSGQVTIRRFRIDETPALPSEPSSAPLDEFLPSVRLGWGIDETTTLERLRDRFLDVDPRDPRLERVARTIVTGTAKPEEHAAELVKVSRLDRAKKLYRWALENVEPAGQNDARQSIMSRRGSPVGAFIYLARLLGIRAVPAVVEDKLKKPPKGPMERAERFSALAVVIPGERGEPDTWLYPEGKYTPFGHLPGPLRGQPAVLLDRALTHVTTVNEGPRDGFKSSGKVKLRDDGSATFALKLEYQGRVAIVLREEIQSIPDRDRLKAALEAELLPRSLPGARVSTFEVQNLEDLDAPLTLSFELEIARFARSAEGGLVIAPPFSSAIALARFFELPKRETPLILPIQASLRTEVDVAVELPSGAKVRELAAPASASEGGVTYSISDGFEGGVLRFRRTVDVPALRVDPADYERLGEAARALDDAIHREILVELP